MPTEALRSGVCAIIVSCNRKELLREALAALRSQTAQVACCLVVDNASTDGTGEMVEREYPEVRYLRLKQNVGGAGGFFAGMKWAYESGYEWLWLMDDDTITAPTTLDELLKAYERFAAPQRPLLLASKVLWTDGSLHYMNPSRAKLPDLEALYTSVAQATLSIRSTTFVSCLVHRDLVARYGYPIADYFIWGDDTEYSARVLRENFGVMVPASTVMHKTARKHTALDAPPERYYYHVRNTLWMLAHSKAWAPMEKLRNTITLTAWIARYLKMTPNRFRGIKSIAAGALDGFVTSPQAIDVARDCSETSLNLSVNQSAMELPLLPALPAHPLVSVMIVNYNYERFLPEAIESVLRQTYQDFEIVICDDGSKDGSREIISRYAAQDSRIKYIFQENGGVGVALNSTYRGSSGAIISMLDADDLFLPEKLQRVVEKFAPGGRVGTVLNALTKIDSDGSVIGSIPQFGTLDRGELRERLLQSAAHWSVAPTSGVSFRRECAEHVFPIPDQQFRTEVDGYMCTIAPLFYAVDAIDEPLTIYRVHSSNVTTVSAIDLRYCDRVMNAGERVFAVLSTRAAQYGWPVTKLEHNPTYCEMRLIRDVLVDAPFREKREHIRDLREAAARVQTADRGKTRAKAGLLSAAALLPQAAAKRVIDAIYLPNRLKTSGSRLARSLRPRSRGNQGI